MLKIRGKYAMMMQKRGKTMEWTQILVILLGNAGIFMPMFFWLRSEANADRRDIMNIIKEIQNEMKEFHGRLCAIEERNKGNK